MCGVMPLLLAAARAWHPGRASGPRRLPRPCPCPCPRPARMRRPCATATPQPHSLWRPCLPTATAGCTAGMYHLVQHSVAGAACMHGVCSVRATAFGLPCLQLHHDALRAHKAPPLLQGPAMLRTLSITAAGQHAAGPPPRHCIWNAFAPNRPIVYASQSCELMSSTLSLTRRPSSGLAVHARACAFSCCPVLCAIRTAGTSGRFREPSRSRKE